MSYLMEQAGGQAFTGNQRVWTSMSLQNLHFRIRFFTKLTIHFGRTKLNQLKFITHVG